MFNASFFRGAHAGRNLSLRRDRVVVFLTFGSSLGFLFSDLAITRSDDRFPTPLHTVSIFFVLLSYTTLHTSDSPLAPSIFKWYSCFCAASSSIRIQLWSIWMIFFHHYWIVHIIIDGNYCIAIIFVYSCMNSDSEFHCYETRNELIKIPAFGIIYTCLIDDCKNVGVHLNW